MQRLITILSRISLGSFVGLFLFVTFDLHVNDHRHPPLEAKAWFKDFTGRVRQHKVAFGLWLLGWGLTAQGIIAPEFPDWGERQ